MTAPATRPTGVGGSVNFACGERIRYDDTNEEHRANRLCRELPRPLITCPTHGLEQAGCAVSGPAHLLFPHPDDYAEAMWEVQMDRAYDLEMDDADCA